MSLETQWQKIRPVFTILRIWDRLHSFFYELETSHKGPLPEERRISSNINTLTDSMRAVPASDWTQFCLSLGWTVYGAVALSWCKDAELAKVWEGWEASGFPLKPLPEYERPARFVNPALMPKTRSLKGIVDEMGNSSLAICAAIASSPEPLEFDLDSSMIKSAKPQLAAFLKSRMLEKQNRTGEEEALLKVWSDAVKDTEYDIWEGS